MPQNEYKLLNVQGSDLKNGQKVEAEVEGIEGAKVLLLKVNDQLRALGSKCTRKSSLKGAPLVKGVIADDGRITCPWHGACFNTDSGDIENAPALDHLNTYLVNVRDNDVYITGDESAIKTGRRVPDIKCSAHSKTNVVIVGGGSGAIGAIEGLREKGFKGKIIVLSKESSLPFDRTKLSKTLISDISKLQWRDESYFKSSDVEFHLETEVDSVNFDAYEVQTKDGKTFSYTTVIFATGGAPKSLPMEGFKSLGNIFVLRGLDDVKEILKATGENRKKIAVIGSSFIGMEVGKCLAGKENDVTIIGMEGTPLERVMGEKVGKIFQRQLEKSGVKFEMNASVEDAKPSSSDASKVGFVQLKGGKQIEADLVVLGVGVAPATEYLKKSGIQLEDDGSVSVDDHWRVEGIPYAYAVGDIASYPYPYSSKPGTKVRIEHWNVAQNGGRQAALHIVNKQKPTAFIPVFWSALGAQLRYCGHTSPKNDEYDDVIIKGNPDEDKWVAYYTSGEKVVAVASQNQDPVVIQSAELMRRKIMPKKKEILSGVNVLDIYVPAGVRIAA
ncbi:hypothetical protein EDC01DRAFT_618353 [Geopyxis carbonaria]|nr:hypothetical protein EDC01DRAFT_618353 [Geopyxis carbonaria]